jgi:hypothetical protein
METLNIRSLILFGVLLCLVYENSHETNITSKIKTDDTKTLDIGLNFLINSRKLNNIRFVKHPGQHTLLYLSLLLLSNASDIESNPGPRAPKYPRQVCYKAVTWKHRGVACDDCSKWYHVECMYMSTTVYNALASSNISWHCVTCGMHNFSSSLFESFMVNTSNSFDQLSNSSVVVSPGLPAFTSSPIKPNRTDRNNYYKPRNTKVLVVNLKY